MTIWKFPLKLEDEQFVVMPAGAKILSAQLLHLQLCLWAAVDKDEPNVRRKIFIRGTGHTLGAAHHAAFIDTVQDRRSGRTLMWHLFDGGQFDLEPTEETHASTNHSN